MEALVLVALAFGGLLLVAPVLALVALSRANRLQREVDLLRARIDGRGMAPAAPVPPAPRAAEPPTSPTVERPTPAAAEPPRPPSAGPPTPPAAAGPAPTAQEPPTPPTSVPPGRPPAVPPPPPATPEEVPDFATNIGPRLLVATGALAFMAALGLFVRYAWENEWVGPTGRILLGALTSLGLLAGGIRLMGREYRPLGQGLAAIGLAGLYLTAFGAHGFYDLIPKSAAGLFMLVVTGCSVALADRLDGRLLASLAWIGGYLTPVLLATGEDRGESLFAYLLLLGAGALALDHRKPWPETTPLAFLGSMALYAAWFARHFRPERFEVAAAGLVLLTGLFSLGMARKARGIGLGAVLLVAAFWAAAIVSRADRPELVIVLSLGLGALALREARRLGFGLAVVAAIAVGFPFLAWAAGFYRPDRFGLAAAWLVGGVLLFLVLELPEPRSALAFPAAAFAAGGLGAAALAALTDRPAALLALLAAQAGLAVLLAARWAWAEAVGVAAASLAVAAWFGRYYRAGRGDDALLLAVPVAGLYLLSLVVRGFVLGQPIRTAGVVAHLANAAFLWAVLYRVLYEPHPGWLGAAAIGLAALYLALGLLALRRRPADPAQARATLGLAAGFLTLAIPVQLGLHGITLSWAVEGVLLLWLGVRFGSSLTRLGGYAVLGLTVGRLLARHLPLHAAPFAPVLNPSFGTWLAVIVLLGLGVLVTRGTREAASEVDQVLRPVVSVVALLMLFGLLTGETQAAFDWQARAAHAAADLAAAQAALRAAPLALSVLWTLFATGLLAGGLGLRNRPLFYAAYGLFGVTAVKVVWVDLATFPTLYRMLSFLALGVLLLAGAWLNLRFRGRLLPGGSQP